MIERPGIDGRDRIIGIVHPEGHLSGMTLSVGLSHARVFADINAATRRGDRPDRIGSSPGYVRRLVWRAGTGPQTNLRLDSQLRNAGGIGDWSARTDLVNGSSELHRLGTAFDRMAADLSRRDAERQQTSERERLLMMEIDHRAKNALAVAQSLVRLTRAETIQDYVAKVQGRIAALARGHKLLADNRWEGADLREILIDELAPFGGRIHFEGPPVRLLASAVQPVSLILHELAANAVYHGALSVQGGSVKVSWWPVPGRRVFASGGARVMALRLPNQHSGQSRPRIALDQRHGQGPAWRRDRRRLGVSGPLHDNDHASRCLHPRGARQGHC